MPGAGATRDDWGKSSFDDIYDQPDPRAYFTRLRPLRYQIPHHAQPVFRRVLAERARLAPAGDPVTVVDVCCSYGINAALLNHDLTLDDLYARYTSPELARLPAPELAEADKRFYAARRRAGAVPVIGIDASAPAVSYAAAAGLLDAGFAENLEAAPASAGLARAMAPAGLITVTGGISYIGPRTFDTLLSLTRTPPHVAVFALRGVSYQPIAGILAAHGLITHTLARTYPQRRFTGPAERQRAITRVTAAGLDPAGRETAGYYHAALYLSRPAAPGG
jgi:SAM-dependent methyltransferase